jgi:hypothetical protein
MANDVAFSALDDLQAMTPAITEPPSFSNAAGVLYFVMKPLGALRFDIRREVRNSGEPHIDLDHRLAPARSRSWLGLSIGAPFLDASRFS